MSRMKPSLQEELTAFLVETISDRSLADRVREGVHGKRNGQGVAVDLTYHWFNDTVTARYDIGSLNERCGDLAHRGSPVLLVPFDGDSLLGVANSMGWIGPKEDKVFGYVDFEAVEHSRLAGAMSQLAIIKRRVQYGGSIIEYTFAGYENGEVLTFPNDKDGKTVPLTAGHFRSALRQRLEVGLKREKRIDGHYWTGRDEFRQYIEASKKNVVDV